MITFDYSPSYRKGKLICDEDTLTMIRNHFSENIKNIGFIKKQSGNHFIPSREYAIQKTGMFDFGIHSEIQEFLVTKQITEVEFTEEFKKQLNSGFKVETFFDGLTYGNRYYGVDAVSEALKVGSGTIVVGTGGGKCWQMGTPMLKYNGDIESVEQLKIGDLLMGPDSKHRTIIGLIQGEEMMYKITPNKYADPVIVNGSHLLALRVTNIGNRKIYDFSRNSYKSGDLVIIAVDDYIKSNEKFKHCVKWHQVGVDFDKSLEEELEIPPYLLGFWLGDGCSTNSNITKPLEYYPILKEECDKVGWIINIYDFYKCPQYNISNGMWRQLRLTKQFGNKHIPKKYLVSSRKNRRLLLAGLLDSGGSIKHSGFEFTNTNKNIIDGVLFLARSLGMSATTPTHRFTKSQHGTICKSWRIFINSNEEFGTKVKIPPARKMNKHISYTGIEISEIGVGEYYGFTLDGPDKLHLLGDFSVVHNSYLMASLLENIYRTQTTPFKCIIVVPGLSLVTQLVGNFEEYGVTFSYSGWTGDDKEKETTNIISNHEVIICNSENFCAKFDYNKKWITNVDVVINDEAHKARKGNQLSKYISKITTLHKFGFTGTLPKEKIDRWKIIGTFGPVIYEKNSKELRDEGFLTNASVKIIKLNHLKATKMGYAAELKYLYNSPERNALLKKVVSKLNNNTLILVNHLEHGENLLQEFQIDGKETFFVKGEMEVLERLQIVEKMEQSNNIVCIAMASIFSTGIDIKNLHYILFVAGGKSFIRTVQSIGRGLRLHSSKNKLVLLDFYDNMKASMNHVEERKSFYDDEQISWSETEIFL